MKRTLQVPRAAHALQVPRATHALQAPHTAHALQVPRAAHALQVPRTAHAWRISRAHSPRSAGPAHAPRLLRACLAALLLAAFPTLVAAQAQVGTPFGNANDPTRPVPPTPMAVGKGIVSAKLVEAGEAEVAERAKDGKPLAGVAIDIRIDGGSTTAAIQAGTVSAQLENGEKVAMLASCVPSKDDAVEVRPLFGLTTASWNVDIEGQKFVCSGRSARLAMHADTGAYHLIASGSPGQERNARMVLLFVAPASALRKVELPGATVAIE